MHSCAPRRFATLLLQAAWLGGLAACMVSPPTVMSPGYAQTRPPPEFRVYPGSTIEVKFLDTPDLNEQQAVRPDGRISLALVGDVRVEGKTVDEVRQELVELYAPLLREPEITVILRGTPGDRVLVAGQVAHPGALPLEGRLTALDAVILAGGPLLEDANLAEVLVLRRSTGRYFGYRVDLVPALRGLPSQPFYLEPADVVYVPRQSRLEQLLGATP